MRKSQKYTAFAVVSFFLLLAAGCCSSRFVSRTKYCHVSIDDVRACLDSLENKDYHSAFEEPFLAQLMELHQKYGCKFTLYGMLEYGKRIPYLGSRYNDEFRRNSSWLKFAFHGIDGYPQGSRHVPAEVFCKGKRQFDSIVVHSLGGSEALAEIVRLDYFYADDQEMDSLKADGVKVLLSSNSYDTSYSLPAHLNEELYRKHRLRYDGMEYLRTDIRTEKTIFPNINLLERAGQDTIVVFAHEWALKKRNQHVFCRYMQLLHKYNYSFICK